jgi:hypothetical protein
VEAVGYLLSAQERDIAQDPSQPTHRDVLLNHPRFHANAVNFAGG